MAEISPIPTGPTNTNNVSVVSTTGGFNFRQLKPQESVHASHNELPHMSQSPPSERQGKRKVTSKGRHHHNLNLNLSHDDECEVQTRDLSNKEHSNPRNGGQEASQQPLCFDNSPIK